MFKGSKKEMDKNDWINPALTVKATLKRIKSCTIVAVFKKNAQTNVR